MIVKNLYFHGSSVSGINKLDLGSKFNNVNNGYGYELNSISISSELDIASNFALNKGEGSIYVLELNEDAKIVELTEIEDSENIEPIINELKKKKIDAIKMASEGEFETIILNPNVVNIVKEYPINLSNKNKIINNINKDITNSPNKEINVIKEELINVTKNKELLFDLGILERDDKELIDKYVKEDSLSKLENINFNHDSYNHLISFNDAKLLKYVTKIDSSLEATHINNCLQYNKKLSLNHINDVENYLDNDTVINSLSKKQYQELYDKDLLQKKEININKLDKHSIKELFDKNPMIVKQLQDLSNLSKDDLKTAIDVLNENLVNTKSFLLKKGTERLIKKLENHLNDTSNSISEKDISKTKERSL